MRKINLLTIIIFFIFLSPKLMSDELTATCSNIKGVGLVLENGKIDVSDDGYGGLTLILKISTNNYNEGTILWNGGMNDGFKETINWVNQTNSAMVYSSGWPEVTRIYTLFYGKDPVSLSMIESQTQLFTNNPQTRSFFGVCDIVVNSSD